MKKVLLSLVCSIAFGSAFSQVTVAHDTVYYNGVPKDNSIVVCKDSITNGTGSAVTVNWSKSGQSLPSGWTLISACDPATCYPSPANGNYYAPLAAGATGKWYIDVKAAPGAADGPAWVTLTTNYGDMTFIFNTWPTSLTDRDVNNFASIYPNPTSSVINVAISNKNISTMNVLNVIGRKVASVAVDASKPNFKYSLDNLADGIYILQFSDSKGKLIGVKKVTKN